MTLTGISSMAMRQLLAELVDGYRRKAQQPVTLEAAGGVDVLRRVEAGEAFDFVVLARDAIDRLAAGGRVDPATRIDLARSRVALAVRAGAPRPTMDSGPAVRDALLAARRVGYSTGPSGRHLLRLLEQWDIAGTLRPRLVEAPPGVAVGVLLARGDADLGVQQLSELVGVPGIDVVGVLPPDIEEVTVFGGAVGAASARPDAAAALLAYCASPAHGEARRRHGMEA